ncbi:hypothetical protein BJY00DRAFT_236040 [Aspergillus carlsbadensis]|nr:hypothetical protein BJY00DRAFT_236040 [Aspergillus carlsbadensis]
MSSPQRALEVIHLHPHSLGLIWSGQSAVYTAHSSHSLCNQSSPVPSVRRTAAQANPFNERPPVDACRRCHIVICPLTRPRPPLRLEVKGQLQNQAMGDPGLSRLKRAWPRLFFVSETCSV